jgi:hypothetical protein
MLEALLDKLETYGFECEAGPLALCVDWQKLRVAALLTHPPSPQRTQEPVAYCQAYELDRLKSGHNASIRSAKFGPSALDGDVPLYTSPPSPQRTPLTDEEIDELRKDCSIGTMMYAKEFARAIEAAHGITAQEKK